MNSHLKWLVALALVLAVATAGIWVWRAHIQSAAAATPATAIDDAPERSLEQIEAAVDASQAFHDGLEQEAKENWKKIHWSPSVDEALKTAQEVKKPVLVLLTVREIGTQDPGRC